MNVSAPQSTGPYALSAVSGFGSSSFGGLSPFGSFGPPYSIGIAPPPPLLLPYGAAGTVGGGSSLQNQSGNPVSVGSSTDGSGAAVLTATLNSSKGGIIAFQSTPPGGLTTSGGTSGGVNLPSLSDANGQAVAYAVSYDSQIQLSDRGGNATTLYSRVDSSGYPAN